MHHQIKIENCYYDALISGEKTCELRYNDRNYQKLDTISFTFLIGGIHREGKWEVTNVLSPPFGLEKGWVVLSLINIS